MGIGDTAFAWIGPLSAIGSASTLIANAWSLEEVEATYLDFIDSYSALAADDDQAAFLAQIHLVQRWRRFPFLDPDLPPELLDHAWPARAAADLFQRRHGQWHERAQRYWKELVAVDGPVLPLPTQ